MYFELHNIGFHKIFQFKHSKFGLTYQYKECQKIYVLSLLFKTVSVLNIYLLYHVKRIVNMHAWCSGGGKENVHVGLFN